MICHIIIHYQCNQQVVTYHDISTVMQTIEQLE